MGCPDTKKPLLSNVKKQLLFSVLCILSISLLSGWLRRSQTLVAVNPSNDWSRNVTVLLWYWPFGRWFNLSGDVCWNLYQIPRCRLVNQRSLFSTADVVVFHNLELLRRRQKLPLDIPRPPGQRWAWMSLEAPAYQGHLQQYANIFNMTISYRRDADVTIPYGELQPREARGPVMDATPLNKSFLVCWVVSNYMNHHRRSSVYKELKAVVPVQVYGRWTKRPLASKALLPTISRCHFYLAFENSLSKDYITEKLWRNAYQGGAVPVVLGPPVEDYEAVAPPHSFIHVDEFASIEDLAKFLRQLAADEKRYSEYFTWKHEWKVKLLADWRERLCRICTQISTLPQHKVYTDLEAWVSATNT